jgi:hypothetical protein
MFWAYALTLALTLGACFVAMLVLHATVHELTGPYLALATPQLIMLTLMMWLRVLEEKRGLRPRQLALLASLFAVFFFAAIAAALLYSAVALHRIKPDDSIFVFFVFAALAGTVTAAIAMYNTTLPTFSARAASRAT